MELAPQGRNPLRGTNEPVLATPVEGNGRGQGARELVDTMRGIEYFRAGDCRVELLDGQSRTIHDRGGRVNAENVGFGKRISPRKIGTNIVSKSPTIIWPSTLTLAPLICQKPTNRMTGNGRTD
jgi:hypothetical protein